MICDIGHHTVSQTTVQVQLGILDSTVYNWLSMLNSGDHVQRYIRASAISDHINRLGKVRILCISIWLIIMCFPCVRPRKPIGWRRVTEAVITLSGRFKWHTGGHSICTGADSIYRVCHPGEYPYTG